MACWGNAGGGTTLRVVAGGAQRLVRAGDQTCWQRADGTFDCTEPCKLCETLFDQPGVVDVTGDVVLLDDGRILEGAQGEPLRGPTPGPKPRRIVATRCGKERDRIGWVVLDATGSVSGAPSCPWTTTWPWNGVADIDGSGDTVCARLEDGRVRCASAGAGYANPMTRHLDDDGFLAIDDVATMSSDDTAICVARRDGTVACAGFHPNPTPEDHPSDALADVVNVDGVTALHVHAHDRTEACVVSGDRVSCNGLGVSTAFDRHPVAIPEIRDAVEVTQFYDGFCARTTQGAVWCWGDDVRNLTGNTSRMAPTEVVKDAVGLAAAGKDIYWLTRQGELARNGKAIDQVDVRPGLRLTAGRAGRHHTGVCIVGDGVTPRCWRGTSPVRFPQGRLRDAAFVGDGLCAVMADGTGACRLDGGRWLGSEQWTHEGKLPKLTEVLPMPYTTFVAKDRFVRCDWTDETGRQAVAPHTLTRQSCTIGPRRDDPNRTQHSLWWLDDGGSFWILPSGHRAITLSGVRDAACNTDCVIVDGAGGVHVFARRPLEGKHGNYGLRRTWTDIPYE